MDFPADFRRPVGGHTAPSIQGAISGSCHGWFIRRFGSRLHVAQERCRLHLASTSRSRSASRHWRSARVGEYLVGAGGTHCPVARLLAPERPRRAVGVQELELQTDAAAVARTRIGNDGEPELILFDDVGGYGWNVPKSDWLNVGCGTLDANRVRDMWSVTHDHLRATGHLPTEAEPQLAHLKGHSYFLFDPVHLGGAQRDNVLLVGDSLGLAHPITAEGILPATVSGRCAAEAILAGDPASYPARLRAHPVLSDYARVFRVMAAARKLRDRLPARSNGHPRKPGKPMARGAVARGFAWMFSGRPLPAPRVIDFLVGR